MISEKSGVRADSEGVNACELSEGVKPESVNESLKLTTMKGGVGRH